MVYIEIAARTHINFTGVRQIALPITKCVAAIRAHLMVQSPERLYIPNRALGMKNPALIAKFPTGILESAK
jgi:hypothetical protein